MQWIRSLSYEEQKKLRACSDKMARGEMVRFMARIQAETEAKLAVGRRKDPYEAAPEENQ